MSGTVTWTPERRAQVKAMLEAGAAYADVAKAMGVTTGAMAGMIFRAGWGRGKPGRKPKLSPEDVANIKTALLCHHKQHELAECYGVTQTTISKIKRGLR